MRTKENLEKCLSIYKKNGRSRYVTLPEMRDFLKKEFNIKVTTKMRKTEVVNLFVDNLSVSTYPKYKTLERFGLIRMDVQEALNVSRAMSQCLVKDIPEKCDLRVQGDYCHYYVNIYDIDDVMGLMEQMQKGARSNDN